MLGSPWRDARLARSGRGCVGQLAGAVTRGSLDAPVRNVGLPRPHVEGRRVKMQHLDGKRPNHMVPSRNGRGCPKRACKTSSHARPTNTHKGQLWGVFNLSTCGGRLAPALNTSLRAHLHIDSVPDESRRGKAVGSFCCPNVIALRMTVIAASKFFCLSRPVTEPS